MARHKLQQIRLVSADDKTQPSFPGGWVLAIFEAVNVFAPECAAQHRLPTSRRTHVRLKRGQTIKQTTYDEIETKLVALVTALFPRVSAINDFAAKYVQEYFRLWKSAAEIAPQWIKALGYEPEKSTVLARALVRDLALRVCYLESCERALDGQQFNHKELALFRHDAPAKIYDALIKEKIHCRKISLEKLAGELGIYEKKLRRLRTGTFPPQQKLLKGLAHAAENQRLLSGIGFIDVLLRKLGLAVGVMNKEVLHAAEVLLSSHHRALMTKGECGCLKIVVANQVKVVNQLSDFAAHGDYLLLHPGFEPLWPKMPDALWRAHLYSLQFARMVDIAQAYLQFAQPENDRELTRFLDNAERKSDSCPYHWMREIQKHNNVLPYNGQAGQHSNSEA
jgi:hypothetical protein